MVPMGRDKLFVALILTVAVSAGAVLYFGRPGQNGDPATAPVGLRLIPPLFDAKPGEQLVVGAGDLEYEYVVRSVLGDRVEVDVFKRLRGEPAPGGPTRVVWNRNGWGMPADTIIRQIEYDVRVLHGRPWPCWRLNVHHKQGARVYWITDELPVNGVVGAARIIKGRVEDELAQGAMRDSFGAIERSKSGLADPPAGGMLSFQPPLHDADEGEVLVLAQGGVEYQYRVVKSSQQSVDVEVRKLGAGESRTVQWDRNLFGLEEGSVLESLEGDEIGVGGVTYPCVRMIVLKDGKRRAYWISGQIAVHGVLRVAPIVDGEPDLTKAYERVR
jgi:hypothetical protein